ncbi:MAG: hypothetical protein NC033_06610 [Clostridiales bacterium]|nr:hypothetical protein [Clostridiales bacterium]
MEFKHAFHVFVDNFSTTYKLLVYRLIVLAITIGLSCAVLVPAIGCISDAQQYTQLQSSVSALWSDVISLNLGELQTRAQAVRDAYGAFTNLLTDKSWLIAVVAVCMCVVYFIDRFLVGVGNYVTGSLVHDKMVMQTNSSFTFTLFKNIKNATLYAIIYAPIAFVYDAVCLVIMWAIVSVGLKGVTVTLVKIFLIAILFLVFSAVKFMFTTDWLPALIDGKMKQRKAVLYAFSRKGKRTAEVLSNALVLKLIVIALNVAAGLFTFCAGLLLTIPASSLILTAYSFVNYFDASKKKYFVDEYTVIGPKKETPVSREEFFKGDEN